ncbi:cuticle protein 8-like [Topomyia yanbarensis]|uniref:cuticle protein 8-like n=1 Tax=Topomyia yanbarensis TaxID=2498891 RepID=UPI00273C8874|nr:cuticle protein 8-like [Topomyia yanbarensis]
MAFESVLVMVLLALASSRALPQHGYATSHQISNFQHNIAPVHHVAAIHAAPIHHTIVKEVEHHAPANYEFSYSVHDEHTGDIKSQQEKRHGDEVHGQYSLIDSDGHQRIVDYHADHHRGFNAVVRRVPTNVKIAQPVHKLIAQPIHYAPLAHASISHHIAPVAHHIQGHHAATSYSTQHHY